MKKLIYIAILIPFVSFAQNGNDTLRFYNCVKEFYTLLYSNKVSISQLEKVYVNSSGGYDSKLFIKKRCNNNRDSCKKALELRQWHADTATSYVMLQMKKYSKELTDGLTQTKLYQLIKKAKIIEFGDEFTTGLELSFPNGNIVHFELNNDEPTQIVYIWLNNGNLIDDVIAEEKNPQKLFRKGTVISGDSIANIREAATIDSKIVSKIYQNEIFYYTPIGKSDYWPVAKKEGEKYIGYICKNKIIPYNAFPKQLKDKVFEERNNKK